MKVTLGENQLILEPETEFERNWLQLEFHKVDGGPVYKARWFYHCEKDSLAILDKQVEENVK